MKGTSESPGARLPILVLSLLRGQKVRFTGYLIGAGQWGLNMGSV